MNRTRPLRLSAALIAVALVAASCGSDRKADSTTTVASTTATTVATTEAPAGSTADTTAATTAETTAESTAGSTADTTAATTAATEAAPTTEAAPDVPMFGDAPWPCGPAVGTNTDTGNEVGVTADSVTIAGGDDAGYSGAPGLNHEMTDAMKALVAKCNDLGGINGRQIKFNYYDAQLLNVGPAIQGACDDKNFFLVGEGWAFDSNQEEIRLGCGLPAVPTYTVSAAFAMGKDVFNSVPNPADETPAGAFAQTTKLLGDAVKHVGALVANYSATQETRDKAVAVATNFGWTWAETNLEYNVTGEADWTPFVKQLQDAGATAVFWSGSCLPNLQLYAQAAKANGFDVPIITDTNHYEAKCAAANTDGALDNLYIRMSYIPFEEADVNPATKDYLDLLAASGGDTSQLGMQATSSFLLWATAASACGNELTRACTLTNLANTHSWTGHGLHAETDPGGNHPPSCTVLIRLQGTSYKRVAPDKPGTYDCDPSWIAPVTGVPALEAAKLDANRISQQFAAGG
ncbi:MAG: Branched-chain amino acid transporter substrate-binding protein [Ilumatobacteraceae bacterium]|nr:Branched-chain amino acid transporter substrate-binding protein [Ilumatobacteraceae bacterium]MCU1389407.1 Branched-chain amino acid transporter substrate-binding protein [Ilumatobacteraceae bacterium]